jgi:heterodisulfide reductase subunit A-like polyferredoxin
MTTGLNGSTGSNGHANGSNGITGSHHPENPYYVHTTDRIAIIGAGVAGIAMASALQNANYTNFIVYDKQSSIGGLWLQNYPNIAGTFTETTTVVVFVGLSHPLRKKYAS